MSTLVPFALLAAGVSSPTLLHDTDLAVDTTLIAGAETTAFVAVSGASSLFERRPIRGAKIEFFLDKRSVATAETDARGQAVIRFVVPDLRPGAHDLRVATRSEHGGDSVIYPVHVRRPVVLQLQTDRTEYRPGETLRFAAALVNRANAHPVEGTVSVTVKDPRGTQIWRGTLETAATGFATGRLPLGDDIRLGKYTLEASAGDKLTQATITVREVALPAFFVSIEESKRVVARYPYGEPVQGRVTVRTKDGVVASGDLDAFGRFELAGARPGERLTAKVTDGAGRSESTSYEVPGKEGGLSVVIVPERRTLARDRPQYVTVITTDGAGHLAPATVTLGGRNVAVTGRRTERSLGAVRFAVTPGAQRPRVTATAVAGSDHVSATLPLETEEAGPFIRPTRAVVPGGSPVRVAGRFPRSRSPIVFTLIREKTPLATTVANPDRYGRVTADLHPPQGVFGLATVRAVEISADDSGAPSSRRAAASIYLTPTPLSVELSGRTRHRPGEIGKVLARVTDAGGAPAARVGLFASVVDERALAVGRKQRDLVEILTSLDVEHADVLGLAFVDLAGREGPQYRVAQRAIVESLPPEDVTPVIRLDTAIRLEAERRRVSLLRENVLEVLVKTTAPIGRYSRARGWRYARALAEVLARAGMKDQEARDPWGRPLTWRYAEALDASFAFTRMATDVAERRLDSAAAALNAAGRPKAGVGLWDLVKEDRLDPHLAVDPWGGRIALSNAGGGVLRSSGPDGHFGTKDDLTVQGVFEARGTAGFGAYGSGFGGGGAGVGGLGAKHVHAVRVSSGPALLRTRFDETVLWAGNALTNAEGEAVLSIPFSHSITGWRLAVDALGPKGAVGRGTKRLETFLPLSVDADVPRRLTTGDDYVLNVVVANHTDGEQRLTVEAYASGAIGSRAAKRTRVALPSGTTRATRFAIRADRAGRGRVKLRLSTADGTVVDRVQREVRVEGPGRMERLGRSVDLTSAGLAFDLEQAPAPGSMKGRLRLFRNPLDQALDGLEDLLREPHGCFEQTSSSTYPNLMVLRLMKESDEGKKIRARAFDLVAKGYQRLISYEVPGGGFSWFGKAPANKALTAYGLMEFADMSKVYPVDPALIERTKQWLLRQQHPDGSFAPDASFLHDWSAIQGTLSTTAYVTWALAAAGAEGDGVDRALEFLSKNEAKLTKRPYLLALWIAAKEETTPGAGRRILARLVPERRKDGLAFSAGGETLFYARGAAADVQVTALAIPALLGARRHTDAREALRWLWSARGPRYGWGSPQGTVLALRAATAMAGASAPKGRVGVRLDGRAIGHIDLDATDVPTLALPAGLSTGRHVLSLDRKVPLLADLDLAWRSSEAPVPITRGLSVRLEVPTGPTRVGRTARVRLRVRNPSSKDVVMPTAVVPVPPGFEPSRASLKRLVAGGRVERFEATGASIHLYLTKLAGGETLDLDYEMVAKAECDVTQRSAAVYAYYSPEIRGETRNRRIRATLPD